MSNVFLLTCWEIKKWKLCFSNILHIEDYLFTRISIFISKGLLINICINNEIETIFSYFFACRSYVYLHTYQCISLNVCLSRLGNWH